MNRTEIEVDDAMAATVDDLLPSDGRLGPDMMCWLDGAFLTIEGTVHHHLLEDLLADLVFCLRGDTQIVGRTRDGQVQYNLHADEERYMRISASVLARAHELRVLRGEAVTVAELEDLERVQQAQDALAALRRLDAMSAAPKAR